MPAKAAAVPIHRENLVIYLGKNMGAVVGIAVGKRRANSRVQSEKIPAFQALFH